MYVEIGELNISFRGIYDKFFVEEIENTLARFGYSLVSSFEENNIVSLVFKKPIG